MEHKLHVVSRGELEDITRYGNTRGRPGSKAPSASNNGSRMYNPMSRGLPSSASLEMLQPDDVMGEVKQVYHPAKAFHKICMFNMSSTCSRAFVKFTNFVFEKFIFVISVGFKYANVAVYDTIFQSMTNLTKELLSPDHQYFIYLQWTWK